MAKHTQTICRQFADELFECVWPFCGIGAWRVKIHFHIETTFLTEITKIFNTMSHIAKSQQLICALQ